MEKNSLNNFICHLSFLTKLSPNHTPPLISICEFLKPYKILFLEFESFVKAWIWIGKKNSLNNCTCHLSFLKKLSGNHPYPLISICEFLKPYKLLFLKFEWLNVNWKKNSLNNFICYLSWLRKLSPTHTYPLISICELLNPTSY